MTMIDLSAKHDSRHQVIKKKRADFKSAPIKKRFRLLSQPRALLGDDALIQFFEQGFGLVETRAGLQIAGLPAAFTQRSII